MSRFSAALTVAFTLLTFGYVSAQADLVVESAELSFTEFAAGEILVVDITVANRGDTSAASSSVALSLPFPYAPPFAIGRVPGIAAGQTAEVSLLYRFAPGDVGSVFEVQVEADVHEEIAEINEDNRRLAATQNGGREIFVSRDSSMAQGRTAPYPLLFIHGLNSNSNTWDPLVDKLQSQRGWTEGGRLDYCLNPDGNQETADGFVLRFSNILKSGDIYRLNFDVSNRGTPFVADDNINFNDHNSDESAITKQGMAVAGAVSRIREVTGADKVILVAHSMGGLASREYIQNRSNWPTDGAHHIAKLITIGTPHGGSNRDIGFLSLFGGADDASEAIRDLRYDGYDGAGHFLQGGLETFNSDFHNSDVNCDGRVWGLITGLNQRIWPNDVDVSAVAGYGTHLGDLFSDGDGLVKRAHANPSNFLVPSSPLRWVQSDLFEVDAGHTDLHTEELNAVLKALDEPGGHGHPYQVELNSLLSGTIDVQAANNPLQAPHNELDYDIYEFEVEQPGWLEVGLSNFPAVTGGLLVIDANREVIGTQEIDALEHSTVNLELESPGTYSVYVIGDPSYNTNGLPYYLWTDFTPFAELAPLVSSTETTGCGPLEIDFVSTATGTPDSLLWTFAGGSVEESRVANPTVSFSEPGEHAVSLTVFRGNRSKSIALTDYVRVESPADVGGFATVQNGGSVEFRSQVFGQRAVSSVSWEFGDGSVSSEEHPTHSYSEPGQYLVRLLATSACGSSSHSFPVEIEATGISSGVSEYTSLEASVFPNPTSGEIYIQLPANVPDAGDASVFDVTGRRVLGEPLHAGAAKLDLSAHPAGVYQVIVSSEGLGGSWRVVKN